MTALGDVLDYMPRVISPGRFNPGLTYDEWIMTGFPLLEFHRVDDGSVAGDDRLGRHA